MNKHNTCSTCVWNVTARCTCEDGHYKGSPVKSWNTCSTHKAPVPSTAELIDRLATCALALDHLAGKAAGEYKGALQGNLAIKPSPLRQAAQAVRDHAPGIEARRTLARS